MILPILEMKKKLLQKAKQMQQCNLNTLSLSDILFLINDTCSDNKTILKDNNPNVYNLDSFAYELEKEQLKGNNIIAVSNFGLPTPDKIYFKSAN